MLSLRIPSFYQQWKTLDVKFSQPISLIVLVFAAHAGRELLPHAAQVCVGVC